MLEQIAEACFDGTLVAGAHFEIIGDRALLTDFAIGLCEHGARRVVVLGACGFELLQRLQPRFEASQLLLACPDRTRPPVVLDSRAGQLRFAGRARNARLLQRRLRAAQLAGGGAAIGVGAIALHLDVVRFHLQLRQRLGHALARRRGMLERVAQRRRRIDRREHLAARRFDVGLEPLDLAKRGIRRLRVALERSSRAIALLGGRGGAFAPFGGRGARRLAARLQRTQLRGHRLRPHPQRIDLLRVESNLLLAAVDLELVRVSRLASRRGAGLRFGELDPQAAEIGLDLGEPGSRRRFALARVGQPRPRRFDDLRELTILPREQHLFEPAELVAELLVALRLRRLPLQRPALLVHLEDDVVDAREVLLRGLELQLGGAPPRLVLGHAGGFFDQLTAIGRPRAEDEADLSLLDDRVSLRAKPGVHEELVHVAQPADLAVDQVLAFARAIQPPRHLDLARERLDDVIRRVAVAVAVPIAVRMRVAVPVAITVAVGVAVAAGMVVLGEGRAVQRLEHAREAQPHFGGRGRLPRVAAAEDDVLHPIAAQALGALLAHHPRDGVGDVALAAPVRADDGGDPLVEGQLRAIGERFEPVDL